MSPGSPGPRSPGSATGIDEGVKEFLSRRLDHTWFPHLFAGRHVPGRAGGAPGGPPGPGGGHRRVGPGPPGDPGTWPRGTPRPPIWIAPGVVEGLNPWKDEDHARTQEVPR